MTTREQVYAIFEHSQSKLSIRLLILLLLLNMSTFSAKNAYYALTINHETERWRINAGRPLPNITHPTRTIIWTRHEQVGIGNTLGGFDKVLLDSLSENRTLIIHSVILEKFCELVKCSLRKLERYRKQEGDNVTQVGHFQVDLRPPNVRQHGPDPLQVFYESAGCDTSLPSGRINTNRYYWPKMCLYSKVLETLIVGGPTGRLQKEKHWLSKYYVGARSRFDAVMNFRQSNLTTIAVYDFVVHLRTLALIEDLSSEDGHPKDTKAKAETFMRAEMFSSMVRCFADQIYESAKKLPRPETNKVTIFLATDGLEVRDEFAVQLTQQLELRLNAERARDDSEWGVEVDYFSAKLPPAHFFVWTYGLDRMKPTDWRTLAGTTAEWLCMSSGREMFTVKGLKGGERALPSSFALSAAAFGKAMNMWFLQGSSASKCTWLPLAFFSR